jgi:phage protein U
MLMGWGPYRFTVPNYSVETIRRSIQARVEPQPIIGARPKLHKLGPGAETITLESSFYPQHLNGNGLTQLAGIRQAVNALESMQLVHINGSGMNVFGKWVATSIDDEQTMLDASGSPQCVTTTLTMTLDEDAPARAIAVDAVLKSANFSASLSISSSGLSATIGIGF